MILTSKHRSWLHHVKSPDTGQEPIATKPIALQHNR